MSTETRTIRPYQGTDIFQFLLDGATLKIGDRTIEGGGRSSVTVDEYLNHPITLSVAALAGDQTAVGRNISDGLAVLGLTPGDVEFVVLASSPRLKIVDVVHACQLDDPDGIPSEIRFPRPRPRSMQGPVGGADVRVYFCLARQFAPRALQPWRKGTWLGKQEFMLRTQASGVGFMPVKLTDDLRAELGLDHDVTKYARVDPEISVFDHDVPADAVMVYIDESLLDRLSVAARTVAGKQVQRQIFLDAAWAIANRAQSEVLEAEHLFAAAIDEFAGSLAHGLVVMLAGAGGDAEARRSREAHFRQLVHDPAKFIANLEARLASRRDVMALFED